MINTDRIPLVLPVPKIPRWTPCQLPESWTINYKNSDTMLKCWNHQFLPHRNIFEPPENIWKSCNYSFWGTQFRLGRDWIPISSPLLAKAVIPLLVSHEANPIYIPSKIHSYSFDLICTSNPTLSSTCLAGDIFSYTYSHVAIPHIFRIQLPFKGGPRALLYRPVVPAAAVSRPTSHCSAARCRCWGSSAASRRTSRRAAYAMRCRPTCRCLCQWIPCKTSNQWWVDIGWVWWVRWWEVGRLGVWDWLEKCGRLSSKSQLELGKKSAKNVTNHFVGQDGTWGAKSCYQSDHNLLCFVLEMSSLRHFWAIPRWYRWSNRYCGSAAKLPGPPA